MQAGREAGLGSKGYSFGMKLVIAIVQDYDTDRFLRGVSAAGLRATRIASTGGFLRMGNTTVFLGVEDDQVPGCLEILAATCRSRVERPPAHLMEEFGLLGPGTITEVTIGGAVVFIVSVRDFIRMEVTRA
jgi:uncharacterized protein YaaQ